MNEYPDTTMAIVSNLWLRQMHFKKAGDRNEGHVHSFDHVTLLAKGSVTVDVEGKLTDFAAPHMIYVQAGKSHFLIAKEDDTLAYCVHAIRNADYAGDIMDPAMIPEGVEKLSDIPSVRPL